LKHLEPDTSTMESGKWRSKKQGGIRYK